MITVVVRCNYLKACMWVSQSDRSGQIFFVIAHYKLIWRWWHRLAISFTHHISRVVLFAWYIKWECKRIKMWEVRGVSAKIAGHVVVLRRPRRRGSGTLSAVSAGHANAWQPWFGDPESRVYGGSSPYVKRMLSTSFFICWLIHLLCPDSLTFKGIWTE